MTTFNIPKRRFTQYGSERRVGIEIEFTGVGLRESAQLIQSLFGGTLVGHHRFKFEVKNSSLGDFSIDSDASFVTKRKWEKYLDLVGLDHAASSISRIGQTIEDIVASVSEEIVPFEIASPPIPFSKLQSMDELRNELQRAGAVGTHAHFFSAFGLQFNPEMPDLRPNTLHAYMRAFFLAYDSLLATEDIPIARKVLPFIEPFAVDYIDQVLDPTYKPTLNGFMRDYLERNPTRNRPLDWLPLFAHLNKDLVFEYPVEKDLIKPRPTLHYRLPSSLIDDPSWSIATEWNKWVIIDDLAANLVISPELLSSLSLERFSGFSSTEELQS